MVESNQPVVALDPCRCLNVGQLSMDSRVYIAVSEQPVVALDSRV